MNWIDKFQKLFIDEDQVELDTAEQIVNTQLDAETSMDPSTLKGLVELSKKSDTLFKHKESYKMIYNLMYSSDHSTALHTQFGNLTSSELMTIYIGVLDLFLDPTSKPNRKGQTKTRVDAARKVSAQFLPFFTESRTYPMSDDVDRMVKLASFLPKDASRITVSYSFFLNYFIQNCKYQQPTKETQELLNIIYSRRLDYKTPKPMHIE